MFRNMRCAPAHRGGVTSASLVATAAALSVLAVAGAMAPAAHAFKPRDEFGHVGIVSDAARQISRLSSDRSATYRFSPQAVDELRNNTAGVDDPINGEFFDSVAHCDNELLPECTQRMINLKNAAIGKLTAPYPDGPGARQDAGRGLHTVQDFYSHSNWIELGNIGIETALGRRTLPRLGRDQKTCEFFNGGQLSDFGLTNLTTGYFPTRPLATPFGQSSKCVHGLIGDVGLNKDSPDRPGFVAARNAAVGGTIDFFNQILDAPGVAGNDLATRAFMGLEIARPRASSRKRGHARHRAHSHAAARSAPSRTP